MKTKTSKWFETKIQFDKTQKDGTQKKVTEQYVVEAISFTEAEAKIIAETKDCVSGDYGKWYPEHDERNDDTGDPYYLGYSIELPKGTISKLIGRGLSWEDEPVELREE